MNNEYTQYLRLDDRDASFLTLYPVVRGIILQKLKCMDVKYCYSKKPKINMTKMDVVLFGNYY